MKVSAQYAETHFSQLISAADRGEEVEITRPEKPALKLVVTTAASVKSPSKRILGSGRGEMRVPSEEEWRKMDADIARYDVPILWR